MRPRFHPSEVAAVLGLHPYKNRDEALLRVMSKIPELKGKVIAPPTDRELVEKADASLKVGLSDAIATATQAKSAGEIQKVIETYKKSIDGRADVKTIEALTSEIQKQRGVKLEHSAEDAFGGVEHRSDFVKFSCPEYDMIGYIDGMKDGCVVETKNRKRFWREPPSYDFIQLLCYMKMQGNAGGILLENFPGDYKPRVTHVAWSDEKWQEVHQGLLKVCEEINNKTI